MNEHTGGREPRLRTVLREDLRSGDFFGNVRRDFEDLREFYIDEGKAKELGAMRPLRRWIKTFFWLLKALFLKLSPARRLLVVAGFILLFIARTIVIGDRDISVNSDTSFIGGFLLLFVLMLELKDKLIARSELEEGRAVQSALMPERSPHVDGWELWLFTRTANEVGGDLVDFQRLEGERAAVTLADVAGKGLKAALVTAKIQATLRAIAPGRASVGALGALLNRIFYRDTMRTMFASLVYGEIVPGSGTVTFMNAGHMPPLIVRRGGVEELSKGDPALGLFPEAVYAEREAQLAEGEYLIFYSDGLTEAKSGSGEFFGLPRLLAFLPQLAGLDAASAGERIVNAAAAFIGEARAHDDLSLVILRRIGPLQGGGAEAKAV